MRGSVWCSGLRKRGNMESLALNSLFRGTSTGGNTVEMKKNASYEQSTNPYEVGNARIY